jgi:hypothetical protein
MKRLLAVAAIAALAVTSVAGDAEAQRRGGRSRTQVIQTAPAIDLQTLLLLGALGGNGLTGGIGLTGLTALSPLLLQPQASTVIIDGGRGGRRGGRRVVQNPTGPLPALSRRR